MGLTSTIKLHDVPQSSDDMPAETNFEFTVLTLDRAASCKIYFENLYYTILRKPLPREQRRIALENDLATMTHLTPLAKEEIRERWRRNESDYLREKRQKVSAEAFIRLEVIGHGVFGIVSLVREKVSGKLYAMKQVRAWKRANFPEYSRYNRFERLTCSGRGRKGTSELSARSSSQRRLLLLPIARIGSSNSITAFKTGITCTWCALRSVVPE